MNVNLRDACERDFIFARDVYFQTMKGIIERLFGWDQPTEEKRFAQFFKVEEAKIIVVDGRDVGWIAEQLDGINVNIGSLYVIPEMQRCGVGTSVLQLLMAHARRQSKGITLAVVKINPALRFYERNGFRITHEDEFKFYLRAD
jgi:GNAT superfamily N-acetyltransferase